MNRELLAPRDHLRRLIALGAAAAPLLALAACAPANPAPPYETVRVEAEKLVGGRVFADSAASAKAGLWIVSNGAATGNATVPVTSTWFEVRARGDQCDGAPLMTVKVDGRTLATTAVPPTTWTTYGWTGTWGAGKHAVSIGFSNDRRTAICDRNLRVDYVAFRSTVAAPVVTASPSPKATPTPTATPTTPAPTVAPTTPAPTPTATVTPTPTATVTPTPTPTPTPTSGTPAAATNPFAGASFYADPNSTAATRAAALRSGGDTTDAALLDKIAGRASADWFTDATSVSAVEAAVRSRVDTVTTAQALPVLVAYAIPQRDCSGASAGGEPTDADYAAWIGNFAAGIGSRKAVVILEPDSVALWDCLSDAAQTDRLANLRTAVDALTASGSVAVYLDGGNSNWQSVATMAARLRNAGIDKARGFATNVSNFNPTSSEVAYGDQLAAALGKHYVVDTSRNGAGPAAQTCNPTGQALGTAPTTTTASALADAYFWIKKPGESDGACNPGDPPAGQWYEAYALGLAQRAG